MKIKLVLVKSEHDYQNAWTETKIFEVDIPLNAKDGWNVVGAEWPKESEGEGK